MNTVFLFLTFLFSTVLAQAAFDLKPGLWEIETKSNVNGQSSPTRAATRATNPIVQHMNAVQEARMEQLMNDAGTGFGHNGMKVCYEKGTFSQENMDKQQAKGDCKMTDKENLADGMRFHIKCKNSDMISEYHHASPTMYSGWNEIQTKSNKVRTEFSGKFVSADCGNVKPLSLIK